jgi:hypothetical protein
MRNLWLVSVAVVVVTIAAWAALYVTHPIEQAAPRDTCKPSAVAVRDYSLYRFLLQETLRVAETMDRAVIFIAETTDRASNYTSGAYFSFEGLQTRVSESGSDLTLSREALTNFRQLSSHSTLLDRSQFADLPVVLSNEAEIYDVFASGGGWSSLGASTIVRFSRIGFSCDGHQAVLYRSEGCGWLCGGEVITILEAAGDRWEVVASRVLSIS